MDNVTKGAYHCGLKDSPDEHYLIRATDDRCGTKSAIDNLLEINGTPPRDSNPDSDGGGDGIGLVDN